MPLTISPVSRPASGAESKIVAGRIVEYEQHSKAHLGVALAEKKNKWTILNQQGDELELPAERLTLIPGASVDASAGRQEKLRRLSETAAQAAALLEKIDLEEVWTIFLGEKKEVDAPAVAELALGKATGAAFLAARRALIADQIYFKRKKNGFEPRPGSVVEELQAKARAEAEKQKQKDRYVETALLRLKDPQAPLPNPISGLEQLAVHGSGATDAKEFKELLEAIAERGKLAVSGKLEDRAFQLLMALGHFRADQDLAPIRLGRPLTFDEETEAEAAKLVRESGQGEAAVRTDLRDLLCVTIDGAETRDFDDALSAEELPGGGRRLGIHISDVASYIKPGSLLEKAAFRRATSVYTADYLLPMLPASISEDSLSLIESHDRRAMSFFIELDQDLNITKRTLSHSLIRVAKRLTYEEADEILCGGRQGSPYEPLIQALYAAACKYEERRREAGAIQFDRREMSARVRPDGRVELEPCNDDTPARQLVCELMILANESAALFARDHGLPIVFRCQEHPDEPISGQGGHLPEGPAREYFMRGLLKRSTVGTAPGCHSGLGIEAYTQVTSPIRRAVDLITQRQLSNYLSHGVPCYTAEQISEMITVLEQGLDEAIQIQRERNRFWLLHYLIQEDIKQIPAVIVRVDGLKPLAELETLYMTAPFHPAPERGPYVPNNIRELGRRITLRIENINPRGQYLLLREVP